MYELRVRLEFSAAHHLEGYPGDCARPHGHNFELEVFAKSRRLDPIGMAIDFRDLKGAARELIAGWDHQDLNLHPDFRSRNPSAENIARLSYERLSALLDTRQDTWIDRVTVWENRSCSATFYDELRQRERELESRSVVRS